MPFLTINSDRTAGDDFGGYDLALYSDTSGSVSGWHKRTSGGYTSKSGGESISIAAIGPALTEYADDPRTFSDGASNLGNLGVYSGSTVGNGYRITTPADTTARELLIWVGCYAATLSIAASLSDASATVSPNTQITDAAEDGEIGYVRIAFQAASAGQTLTVDVTVGAWVNGNSFANATYNCSAVRTAQIGLEHYTAALAEVQAGTANARVIVIGDSLSAGYQSTSTMAGNAIADSWPAELALQFAENPAVFTGYLGDNHATDAGSSPNAYNSKVTQGTGWSVNALESIGGRQFNGGTTNGAAHSFTPGFTFTKFRVTYVRYSGSPEYTVNVDGGSSLGTLNMNDTVGGVFFEEFTAGGTTINVVSNGTANGRILGIEAWDDANKSVHIVTAGVPGWTAGNWATATNDYSPVNGIRAMQADLVLILIGTNDTTASDRVNFRINLRRVIYAAKAHGSVMLIGFPYMGSFSGSPSEATQDLWRGDMAAVAAECGVAFIDPTDDADWSSYSAANSAGFMDADVVHLSDAGAIDWATQVLPHVDLAPPVVMTYARPDADISSGPWVPSTGSDLYAMVDETPASDSDYIKTDAEGAFLLGLTTPSIDPGDQTLKYRVGGSPDKKITITLRRGATDHQSWVHDPCPSTLTEFSRAITTAITDVSALRVYGNVEAATSPPTAKVTWGAVGTGASGTTSCTPSYPTGISADTSELILVVTGRSNTASTAFAITGGGWTLIDDLEAGTGTWGVDTGTRRAAIYRKDTVTGSESGSITVTLAGTTSNTLRATIHRLVKPAGYTVDIASSDGADTTNGTGFSATGGATIPFAPLDLLMIAVAQNIDTGTQSSQSITASGITFGTRTNRASTAVTNGNDHRHIVDTVPVSSGTATVAPTYAYTASASASGPVVFARFRAVAPTEKARVSFIEFSAPENASGDQTLSPPLVTRSKTIYALTVTPGAVTVNPPLTTRTRSLFAPTIGQSVNPPLVTRSRALFEPTVTVGEVTVSPPLVTRSKSLYAPTVSQGSTNLAVPLVTRSKSLFAPTVTPGSVTISPDLLTRSKALYAPTITTGAVTISPPLVSRGRALYSPSIAVGSVTISPPLLTRSKSLYAPAVVGDGTISPPLVTRSKSLYAPTVTPGAVTLQPPLVTRAKVIYAPTVSLASLQNLALPLLSRTKAIYEPSLSDQVRRRHAGTRKNYIIKGQKYALTDYELALLIQQMLNEVKRPEVQVVSEREVKQISRKVWKRLKESLSSLEALSLETVQEVVESDVIEYDDEDDEEILMLL